ncbi:MAG: hypothetical protein DSY43_05455 [Gammaproteobacteria bacterium]|nr:MAG: hypothetical protein DSY43_05455 [Gammaproteobacteria bacterium]
MTCPSQPPSQQNSQTASSHTPRVYTVTTANVSGGKLWFFDHHLSQSTLNGRNGSNACTFITIILAKAIITNSSTLAFPSQSLSPVWAVIMPTNCISKGNDIHHNVTGGRPTNFSVSDAVSHLSSIGNITAEDSFDVDFTCQNTAVPQSSLAFYLQRLVAEPQLAAVVIINDLSICFLGRVNELLLLDSHLHGPYGALIGKTTLADVERYLVTCKQWLSPNTTLCSITFINFR